MFKSTFDLFTPFYAVIFNIIVSLIMGLIVSFIYKAIKRKEGTTKGFIVALVILPVIVSVLVAVVNLRSAELNSAGLEVGLVLAGIFALTRFRSDPLNVEDLSYIILSFFIGVASGLGYAGYTIIGSLVTSLIIVLISATRFNQVSKQDKRLRIVVPEELNYEEVFEAILQKYCVYQALDRVKTVDFGQLFELSYNITLKKGLSEKALLDEIRAKNGNLEVMLTSRQQ